MSARQRERGSPASEPVRHALLSKKMSQDTQLVSSNIQQLLIQQLFLHRDFVWQISQWTIRAIFRTPRSAPWPPTPWACSMSSRNGYHHICTFKSCLWCQGFAHASDPGEEPHQFLCGKAVENQQKQCKSGPIYGMSDYRSQAVRCRPINPMHQT